MTTTAAKGMFYHTARQIGFTAGITERTIVGSKNLVVGGAKKIGSLRVKVTKSHDFTSELNAYEKAETKRKKGDLLVLSADEVRYMLSKE